MLPPAKVLLVVLPLVSKRDVELKSPRNKHSVANKVGGGGTELGPQLVKTAEFS